MLNKILLKFEFYDMKSFHTKTFKIKQVINRNYFLILYLKLFELKKFKKSGSLNSEIETYCITSTFLS